MEVVGAVVGEVVVATGRILCCSIYSKMKNTVKFQSNLDVLKKEMEHLLALRDGVKNEMDLAEREGKVVKPLVTKWLEKVEEIQLKVNQIQAVKLSQLSLNCSKRYRISREATEKLKDIEEHLEDGRSHSVAVAINHPMPRAVERIPGPTIQDQTTPSKTLDEIMALLSDDEVQRIGIWGMGGVGKTTLVRSLNNKLKSISSIIQPFGIVIWVTISQNFDIQKVQKQIAERLNLASIMGESKERLTNRLYEKLEKVEKFLLILDDVWEQIDLDNLGVPRPEDHKGSKIILTTRFLDVCRHMMTDRQVKVAVLNDDESWQLFSRNAGNVTSLEHISPFAKAIARECCGLPLALVAMGAAMREKTKVELWKHALNELQRAVSCPRHIADKIYKPLKWSYDSLEGKQMKYCFLYCSLFPEDFSIAISQLAQCWLAEGLLNDQENYEDSFNRVINLIESLKDSCLLEDGTRKDTVKMHDVVRDVAIWIASSSEDECKSLVRSGIGLSEMSVVELSDNSLKRVSFMNNKIVRLPNCVIQCSEASTLLLQGNFGLNKVPEKFLQGFEALKVLNMGATRIHSLPLSLLQLGELRALLLRGCHNLKELPPLEGLCRLQVLDLSGTCIKELPRGMKNLNNLKQLNLSLTHYLETIQAGIISRLFCLEVLNMTRSAYYFSMQRDVPGYMACFEELKCLERLLVLYIKFKRIPNFSNEDIFFINRLRQFHFFIEDASQSSKFDQLHDINRKSLARGKRAVTIKSFNLHPEEVLFGPLLSTANDLMLAHCMGLSDMLNYLVINSVDCFAGLKSLTIQSCSGSVWQRGCVAQHDLLPNLEELYLQDLDYVKSISELLGHLGLRFLRLKLIKVEYCSEMEYLLSFGHFIHVLPNLEVIEVRCCDRLGELFIYDSIQYIAPDPVVPSLRILKLESLPKLRTLCRDEEIWPHLEQVHVVECNLVRKLPLTDQNVENMKEIKGESQWWNTLKWHAHTTKSSLLPFFHPIQRGIL